MANENNTMQCINGQLMYLFIANGSVENDDGNEMSIVMKISGVVMANES